MVDGATWYEGNVYAVAVANGQNFGHGMRIAPDARPDDGQFDVVLIEGMPRLKAIRALNTIYDGTHVLRGDVHVTRASVVEVEALKGLLPMEVDGESRTGGPFRFETLPGALNMLVSPTL